MLFDDERGWMEKFGRGNGLIECVGIESVRRVEASVDFIDADDLNRG